jgi:HK97 family phage major capsid protein
MKTLQEILTRPTEDETIPEEIYSNLILSVQENLVLAKLVAIKIGRESIPGDSIKVDYADKDAMLVHEIAEGAEVPLDIGTISTFTLTPKKYGLRPLITKEMVEDSKFDLMQYNLNEAAYQMAKKLDSLLAAQLVAGDTAASHTVSGGSAITVADINTAIYNLELDAYEATDFIVSAAVAMDLRNIDTFVEANKAGISNPSKGLIGKILGMNVHQTNNITANYAYVIDRKHALIVAEKRPVTIERYNDVTRDLSGVVITARWDSRYLKEKAISEITTS